ncbi:hypothetical protein SAMN05192561_11270 [Halopenitus malekzadehii]|uniref:Uncharacterized protein n=1 Tax=Halopenitus malekzadehii TaxID=1267564 RepID=A0A1H6JKQ1_9EURY|nr:Gp138 family membrane-puncturing spike protein [Halopenitus malekzadehii]SEH61097.1 hypothetical protein SAMN05192561_11270 [Halopenitus malekzadehii]
MSGNVDVLRQFVENEIRGIYTITFVRVEEVEESTRRAVVSLKSDSDILIDNVPIASPFAMDGAGMIVPIERGVEGLVLHAQEPLSKQIQQRGEQPVESERRFQLEDAVFFPQLWLDEDNIPEHGSNEYVIDLGENAPTLRLNGESGGFQLVDGSGHGIVSDGQGNFTWHAQSVDVNKGPIE